MEKIITTSVTSLLESITSESDIGESLDASMSSSNPQGWMKTIESFIYTKLILIVCLFGIFGNVLNLIVLSQKSLTHTMERMEKSAHSGLIGLALSDMLVCAAVLPSGLIGNLGFQHYHLSFSLVYYVYSPGVINTFMLSSTWLTVVMATSRFLAICYPLQARQFIGKTFTVASLLTAIVVCSLFNVPRYLRNTIVTYEVSNGTLIYFYMDGPNRLTGLAEQIYNWTYFVIGIQLPLVILAICNVQLILALKRSAAMRRQTTMNLRQRHSGVGKSCRAVTNGRSDSIRNSPGEGSYSTAGGGQSAVASRITLTLIVIVVMFIVLFVPAELMNFFRDMAAQDVDRTGIYNLTLAFFNLCQTVNFSVNFVLYCVINTHFRKTIYRLFHCMGLRRAGSTSQNSTSAGVKRLYGSVTEASTYVTYDSPNCHPNTQMFPMKPGVTHSF